jgi:hypothetical protein
MSSKVDIQLLTKRASSSIPCNTCVRHKRCVAGFRSKIKTKFRFKKARTIEKMKRTLVSLGLSPSKELSGAFRDLSKNMTLNRNHAHALWKAMLQVW